MLIHINSKLKEAANTLGSLDHTDTEYAKNIVLSQLTNGFHKNKAQNLLQDFSNSYLPQKSNRTQSNTRYVQWKDTKFVHVLSTAFAPNETVSVKRKQ